MTENRTSPITGRVLPTATEALLDHITGPTEHAVAGPTHTTATTGPTELRDEARETLAESTANFTGEPTGVLIEDGPDDDDEPELASVIA